MKLVHHHVMNLGALAVAQRDIGEDLRCAAHDWGIVVHRGVTGAQTHIVGAKLPAEGEPLLIYQRFNRAGVN